MGMFPTHINKKKEKTMNEQLKKLFELKQQEEVLKAQANDIKEQITVLEQEIGKTAVFAQGKKISNYEQDGFAVKVERKETLKWDQEKLNKARAEIGDSIFLRLFKFEWKHKNKSVLEDFLSDGDQNNARIREALTITDKFSVSIETANA